VSSPQRGEIRFVLGFGAGRGHGPAGLVISDDEFNAGRAGLSILLPITERANSLHVKIDPPIRPHFPNHFIMCPRIVSLDASMVESGWVAGRVPEKTLREVERILRHLLGL